MSQLVIHKAEFKHRRKSFKLTRFMVQQILSIPSGNNPIVLCNTDLKPCDTSAQPNPAFNHGTKLSIDDAVAKLFAEHDEEAFMRMFMIVAISTIFCPSTENFVNLNYLPYLLYISQIQTYDWSSHVLNYILSEVKKYQAFISSKDDGYIYIAYIDFLDMGLNYPKYHQISYDVPRICSVTSEDFSFAAFVDRNFSHPGCATYGILQFRNLASSPYYDDPDNVKVTEIVSEDGSLLCDVPHKTNEKAIIAPDRKESIFFLIQTLSQIKVLQYTMIFHLMSVTNYLVLHNISFIIRFFQHFFFLLLSHYFS
ncbi:hypothetical protein PVAP13_7NG002289 [Panicum virgatum]|uniref:Uncharacterized protein n=1 Tax=Panicum virgatum TaxID=38727 RepID=A0A8T0PWB8_PANVG|nr:hypothetical protein PVAP13_7NG002289 [Panicum virgatum]